MKAGLILALAVLWAAPAFGQLVLEGGASTMFQADGGGVSYFAPGWQADIGAGLAASHPVFGGDFRFTRRGCTFLFGDYSEYLSTIGAGLAVANRGTAFECKDGKRRIRFFAGAVGNLHAVPFFTATTAAAHFGAGISIEQNIGKDFQLQGVSAIAGARRAYLEGIQYHHKAWHFDEAGGYTGRGYFQGDGSFQGQHFAVQASHVDYIGQASFTSEGASIGAGPFSAFASAFQSARYGGQAAGAQLQLGPVTSAVDVLFGGQRQLLVLESEHWRHFTATQFVSHSTATAASFGGGYQGNTLSASLGWQEVFSPLGGFQRAMTITTGIQLPRLTLHLSLDVLPSGVTYSGWGSAYVRGPALATGSASPFAE